MKLANTKRIKDKIMEIAQTKHAFDILNAFFTNGIANSGIAPEMIQVIKQHSEDYYSTTDDSFREKYTVEQVMVRLYFETLIDTFLPGQSQVSSFFINLLILEFQIFDIDDFKNNPYIKNIDFHNKKQGNYELSYRNYQLFEFSIYDIPKHIDKIHIDIPRVGCFKEIKDILLTVFIPKITTYIKPNNHDYYLGTKQKSLVFTGDARFSLILWKLWNWIVKNQL